MSPLQGGSGLLSELVGKPEKKFWWRLLKSPGRSFMSRKERSSLRTKVIVRMEGRPWVWKGVRSWTESLCHPFLFSGLHVQLMESRKPESKNPKSNFTECLQNTESQITPFEDCSVSQKGRGGNFSSLGNLVYLAVSTSEEAAMPEGQAALSGYQERLLPKEGEASESSRFYQSHRQSGAQAHTGNTACWPSLVAGDLGGRQGSGGPGWIIMSKNQCHLGRYYSWNLIYRHGPVKSIDFPFMPFCFNLIMFLKLREGKLG